MNFRFRWIPFIAATVVVAIAVSLGQWQTGRAVEKEILAARLAERQAAPAIVMNDMQKDAPGLVEELEFRRVCVRGEFVRDWPIYLDNRPYQGAAGFYVLMPFRLADTGEHLLVVRGWIARDVRDRMQLPSLSTPSGLVDIEGIARARVGRALQLGQAEALRPSAIVQNAGVANFAQAAGISMLPFVLEQISDSGDGLVRDWPAPSSGVDKHRGYAFQWYALAATALLFFIVTGFRRERR